MITRNIVNLTVETVENLTINQNGGESSISGLEEGYVLHSRSSPEIRYQHPPVSQAVEDDWFNLHMNGASIKNIAISENRNITTVWNAIGRAAIRECFRAKARDDAFVAASPLEQPYTDDHALEECQEKVKNLTAIIKVLNVSE